MLMRPRNNNADVALKVIFNGVYFHICVTPEDLRPASSFNQQEATSSFEVEYLQFISIWHKNVDDGHEAFRNWLLAPCKNLFAKLTLPKPLVHYRTLENYHSRTVHYIRIVNIDGELEPVLRRTDPFLSIYPDLPPTFEDIRGGIEPTDLVGINLPRIHVRDVELIDNGAQDFYEISTEKVIFGGREYYLKEGSQHDLRSEIKFSWCIQTSLVLRDLRVLNIHTLVELDNGYVVGALFNIIDMKHDLNAGKATSLANRMKWFGQIKEIMVQLHGEGICWGDVNPGNVIIDNNDDAWLVYFGGFLTNEFISLQIYETISGDLEGIANLAKFLSLEEAQDGDGQTEN